ncbi:hypothetical protein BSL78_20956 [Apostichopus japonicus]|uniref:VWFC domain-containing protein n=1 Tax=Stichopus japonicus TaxID=307972 RepID=A0A2G8K2G1_STIJA|nr:hypothetical protein BSL78_20956 [Apostichopus japonicus]
MAIVAHGVNPGPNNNENSVSILDKNPCSFRGSFLLHKQSTRLDPCTECLCLNGTTTCEIESCPSDAGCAPKEIVVIDSECCPQCPYRMFVADTEIINTQPLVFKEGDKKRIKFGLDITVDKRRTSRIVRGENLWKLGAWISDNDEGTGEKFSFQENVFSEKDTAQEYSKPAYPPWEWSNLKFNAEFTGGVCEDYQYFCVEFNQADEPISTFDLNFTFTAVDNELERLVDCVSLGECQGMIATDLDWEMEAQDPNFGTATPVTMDVDVSFTQDSVDRKGENMWRVGVFASANEDGSGPRIDQVYQTLDEAGASTAKKGSNLELADVSTNFEIGTVGCTPESSYVCVEFAKVDNPDPDFTLGIESGLVSESGDSLIKCKPQKCYPSK